MPMLSAVSVTFCRHDDHTDVTLRPWRPTQSAILLHKQRPHYLSALIFLRKMEKGDNRYRQKLQVAQ